MSEDIVSCRNGRVLEIWLNKPEDGNRISNSMTLQLVDLLDQGSREASLVLLRARGKDFCIGWGDLGKLPVPGTVEAFERRKDFDHVFNVYSALRACKAPVLGVVQGAARGFGCAIASLCDITIASESAVFQMPELAHNVLPTMVMSALIDRVPAKAINLLVATSREISAEQARAYGMVSDVVPAAGLEQAVQEMLHTLLRVPVPALLGLKEFTRFAPHMEPVGAVEFARSLHATINTSTEMRAAPL